MSKAEKPNQEIQIISYDERDIELLEKNRKLNLKKLFTPEGMDLIIAEIQKEVVNFSADITTKQGRAQIISMAAKVAKCKAPIKNLAAELKEESRKLIDGVNSQWNRYEAAMDALRDEIRKPVDEIEEREAAELKGRQDRLAEILSFKMTHPNSTSGNYEGAIRTVLSLAEFSWGEFEFKAKTTVDEVVAFLKEAFLAAKKAEIDAAELAQLKKEKAEREQKDREAAIAAEAAKKAKFAAEMEAARKAKAVKDAAEAERTRIENEKLKAEEEKRLAEKAAIEAEERAKESERLRLEQEESAKRKKVIDDRLNELALLGMIYNGVHESFLFEDVNVPLLDVKLLTQEEWIKLMAEVEPAVKDRKEKLIEKEKHRIAEEATKKEQERVAEEKRRADLAAEKLAANRKHRAKINSEAEASLFSVVESVTSRLLTDCDTKAIIEAIAKGEVAHVSIEY